MDWCRRCIFDPCSCPSPAEPHHSSSVQSCGQKLPPRFRTKGAPAERQQRDGRRGAVFALRITDHERAELEALQRQGGGPRRLGPWLLWSALRASSSPGITSPAPSSGITRSSTQAAGAGITPPGPARRILDLCAGSGAWSAPYELAGYRVDRITLPELDVRAYVPPSDVWGVLAAPPCDQFSLARNGHPGPRDFASGLETVCACLRIVAQCRPRWWAIENPVGLLSRWLGTPRDVFEPCDFGDPWTKRTALWGDFELPKRGPFVAPLGGGPLCTECDPERRRSTWCSSQAHRAITPAGFARAFFEANP